MDMSWQTGRKVTTTSHYLDCVYSSRQDELLDVMAKLGSAKPELYSTTLIWRTTRNQPPISRLAELQPARPPLDTEKMRLTLYIASHLYH
jgi:hypothetical protein